MGGTSHNKKIIVSLSCVVAVLIVVMIIYMAGGEERETQLRIDEDFQRIEYYTTDYFIDQQEVLRMTIDEKAVKNLEDVYYGALGDENAGFDMNYSRAFSHSDQSEEFKTWRNQPITAPDSLVP